MLTVCLLIERGNYGDQASAERFLQGSSGPIFWNIVVETFLRMFIEHPHIFIKCMQNDFTKIQIRSNTLRSPETDGRLIIPSRFWIILIVSSFLSNLLGVWEVENGSQKQSLHLELSPRCSRTSKLNQREARQEVMWTFRSSKFKMLNRKPFGKKFAKQLSLDP